MSALFTAASSTRLLNSVAPVTAAPWTVGFWFNTPTGVGDQVLLNLTDTAGTSDYWGIYKNNAGTVFFQCQSTAAGYTEVSAATAITSNGWTYIVYRAISAANRRGAILHATGTIDHVQNTTSVTPSGVDAVGLGEAVYSTPDSPLDGFIGEYAMWNVDVQGDGAALQASTLRQMAYGGPFSLRHALGNLVEYRSFRASLESSKDKPSEIYVGAGKPRQVWTNVNGVKLGPHVPLPGSYVRQFQGARLMPAL